MTILRTEKLTKVYGKLVGLRDCTLDASGGEVLGLLGPNGAGKTTLLRMLVGLQKPTSGRAFVLNHDVSSNTTAVREALAYLPGDARLPPAFSGKNALRIWSGLHPRASLERSQQVAERLDLDLSRRVGLMSTGMRQKLALAVVFGIDAQLIILDEPTANLDPTARGEVIKLVLEARQAGRCVVFSNHVFSEVDEVADRVAVLSKGRLAQVTNIQSLRRHYRVTGILPAVVHDIPADYEITWNSQTAGNCRFEVKTQGSLVALLNWLSHQQVDDLRVEPIGLRSVYELAAGEESV
ncbi:MAG: ABC transporter ATP-binding protein [Pirellulaceae bacterium]|nr:ABC transporter ATP-binding protein [Pirellulaceae bacterium]